MAKYEKRITVGYKDGKQIQKRIYGNSKAELERNIFECKKELEKIKNPSNVTLGEYAEKWLDTYKANKSISTQELYRNAIKKFEGLAYVPLKDITRTDLQMLINEHLEHPRTCQILKITLNQIFETAEDYISQNPARKLEVPKYKAKEKRFLTDDELAVIKQCDFKPQDKLFITVLMNTGLRPGEALALQWNDIDFKHMEIRITKAFTWDGNKAVIKGTKTGTNRTVPMNRELYKALNNEQKRGLFVFSREGGAFNKKAYYRMKKRILSVINEALGGNENINMLDGMNMYSFRHTYATFLYYKAVQTGIITMKKAAQIMGHSEEMFIKVYTHLDDSKENLEKLKQIAI